MEKITKFRNRSNYVREKDTPRPHGIQIEYQERLDKDGTSYLVRVGKTDLNAIAQKALPGTLVYNILDRFRNGDLSALGTDGGYYGDFSNVPDSFSESLNLFNKIQHNFSMLNPKLRSLFDNNPSRFAAELQNGSALEKLRSFGKSVKKNVVSPAAANAAAAKESEVMQ